MDTFLRLLCRLLGHRWLTPHSLDVCRLCQRRRPPRQDDRPRDPLP